MHFYGKYNLQAGLIMVPFDVLATSLSQDSAKIAFMRSNKLRETSFDLRLSHVDGREFAEGEMCEADSTVVFTRVRLSNGTKKLWLTSSEKLALTIKALPTLEAIKRISCPTRNKADPVPEHLKCKVCKDILRSPERLSVCGCMACSVCMEYVVMPGLRTESACPICKLPAFVTANDFRTAITCMRTEDMVKEFLANRGKRDLTMVAKVTKATWLPRLPRLPEATLDVASKSPKDDVVAFQLAIKKRWKADPSLGSSTTNTDDSGFSDSDISLSSCDSIPATAAAAKPEHKEREKKRRSIRGDGDDDKIRCLQRDIPRREHYRYQLQQQQHRLQRDDRRQEHIHRQDHDRHNQHDDHRLQHDRSRRQDDDRHHDRHSHQHREQKSESHHDRRQRKEQRSGRSHNSSSSSRRHERSTPYHRQ
jgi:hypothetical protein